MESCHIWSHRLSDLSFAIDAMIYVVSEELIPEVQNGDKTDLSTIGVMLGFITMILIDVALG